LMWKGDGAHEVGLVQKVPDGCALAEGTRIVAVDPRYFRPAEVDALLGDATKARTQLGWTPRISFAQLVKEMVRDDLELARRDHLVQKAGYKAFKHHE
jgi:GDPmannose 4,6-dehydratase